MKKIVILGLVLVLSFTLIGCSEDSSSDTTSDKLVLSDLQAIDETTLEATFNNDTTTQITSFEPQPLPTGEETEVTFSYEDTNFEGKVTLAALNGTVAEIGSSISSDIQAQAQNTSPGDVFVMAVDSSSNIYRTKADDTGNFTLGVPNDKSYVLMYMNHRGQFLGTLIFNNGNNGLQVNQAQIDLGDISIDTSTGEASSSNSTELEGDTESNSTKNPNDITYDGDENKIDLSLYAPLLQDGKDTFIVSESSTEDSYYIRRRKNYTDSNLGKEVIISYEYSATNVKTPTLNDFSLSTIRYFYYSEDFLMYRYKMENDTKSDYSKYLPTVLKEGTSYSTPFSEYKLEEIFNDRTIAGQNVNGIFIKRKNNAGDTVYDCFVKGFGMMGRGYTSIEGDLEGGYPTTYMTIGDKTIGDKPTWFNETDIKNLPTTF